MNIIVQYVDTKNKEDKIMELERIVREERLADDRKRLTKWQNEINKCFDDRLDEYYLEFVKENEMGIDEMNLLRKFCGYIKNDI